MKVSPLIYILISLLLVAVTVCVTIYAKDTYFSKEPTCNTQDLDNTQNDEVDKDSIKEVSTGIFKVEFTYPSEFIPGIRFCLTDINDKSDIKCYFQKGTYDNKTYTNGYNLEDGLTVPVGQYYLDFAEWDVDEGYVGTMYRLNNCTKTANGTHENSEIDNACKNYFNSPYKDQPQMVSIEKYGGASEIIEITKDSITNIGKISVVPYL